MDIVKDSGVPYEIIDYQKTPLSVDQLKRLADEMDIHPLEMIRVKDKVFKEQGYSKKDNREATEWLAILEKNPRFLERPIIQYNRKTMIAKPPDKVREILPEIN